jgi:hypothetical protein
LKEYVDFLYALREDEKQLLKGWSVGCGVR